MMKANDSLHHFTFITLTLIYYDIDSNSNLERRTVPSVSLTDQLKFIVFYFLILV